MTKPESSRREFLKTSAVAAAGVSALGHLSSLRNAVHAGVDETIKIGLVGCGGRGTGAARDALSTDHNCKLVSIGDVFEDRAGRLVESVKGNLGDKADKITVTPDHIFLGFDAYQKVIDSGVDLVILATPPGFRPIHFEYAVKAGKHVFMEKPVATDAPGVRQVLAAAKVAKEKGLKVGVGLQRHHQAGYLETVKRLQDGAIGDILTYRCYWNGAGVWDPPLAWEDKKSEMEYQVRNWYYYNWLSGDHICEQHIHNLDVCNWVKGGYPVRANGMGGRQVRTDKKYGEIYDHHFVEFEYDDGTRMFSQCRHIPNCWNSVTEHAHGTKGTVDISGYRINVNGEEPWRYRDKGRNPYEQEHDDLMAAIRANEAYSEAENGAMSTLTSILGRMATYSGKVIEMEAALNSDISLMPKEFAWDAEPPVKADATGAYPIPTPGITRAV